MVKMPVVGQQGVRALRNGHADGRLMSELGQLRMFGQDITNLVNLHKKDHKPQEIELTKPSRTMLKRPKGNPRPRKARIPAPGRKRLESGAGIFSRTRSRRKTGNDKGKIIQSRIITRKGQQSKKSTQAEADEGWITNGPSVSIESRVSTHLETLADKRNCHVPGAVSIYHADIVDFLRVQEPNLRPVKPRPGNNWHATGCVPHHLSPAQADYYDRTVLADWIAKVCREFGLKDETLLLSLNLLDRCIGIPSAQIRELEPLLLAIGCMRVASKYEEILVNHIDDFLKLVQHSYSRKDVVSAEFAILEMINFQIIQPGHFSVTERIKSLLRIKEEDNQNEVVSQTSIFLVKLGIVYGPSTLIHGDQFMLACAAGLLCAEKVYGANATCLQKLCEVLAVDLESISIMVGHLLALLKQSVRHQPSNPVRRTFLHRVGMGSGVKERKQKTHLN